MRGAQMYGNLGQGLMGVGETGQQLLRNQMATLGGLGQTARGIQDRMYQSQYDASSDLAKEPYERMQFLSSMMQGMFPQGPRTGIQTTYNPPQYSESPLDIFYDYFSGLGGTTGSTTG